MRHGKSGRKFNRNTSHRRAMFRNLAANLVLHGRIETTDAKAKELRGIVERLISTATRLGDTLTADLGKLPEDVRETATAARVAAHRKVAAFLPKYGTRVLPGGGAEDVDLVWKLFHEIAPRYMDRVKAGKGGGYTRITRLLSRRGDNAQMAVIELLESSTSESAAT